MPILKYAGLPDIRLLTVTINHPVTLHFITRQSKSTGQPIRLFLLREIDGKIIRPTCFGGEAQDEKTEQSVRTLINSVCKDHVWTSPDELRALKAVNILPVRAPKAALISSLVLIDLLRHFEMDIKALALEVTLMCLENEANFLHRSLLGLKGAIAAANYKFKQPSNDAHTVQLLKTISPTYPPIWQPYFFTKPYHNKTNVPVFDFKTSAMFAHLSSNPRHIASIVTWTSLIPTSSQLLDQIMNYQLSEWIEKYTQVCQLYDKHKVVLQAQSQSQSDSLDNSQTLSRLIPPPVTLDGLFFDDKAVILGFSPNLSTFQAFKSRHDCLQQMNAWLTWAKQIEQLCPVETHVPSQVPIPHQKGDLPLPSQPTPHLGSIAWRRCVISPSELISSSIAAPPLSASPSEGSTSSSSSSSSHVLSEALQQHSDDTLSLPTNPVPTEPLSSFNHSPNTPTISTHTGRDRNNMLFKTVFCHTLHHTHVFLGYSGRYGNVTNEPPNTTRSRPAAIESRIGLWLQQQGHQATLPGKPFNNRAAHTAASWTNRDNNPNGDNLMSGNVTTQYDQNDLAAIDESRTPHRRHDQIVPESTPDHLTNQLVPVSEPSLDESIDHIIHLSSMHLVPCVFHNHVTDDVQTLHELRRLLPFDTATYSPFVSHFSYSKSPGPIVVKSRSLFMPCKPMTTSMCGVLFLPPLPFSGAHRRSFDFFNDHPRHILNNLKSRLQLPHSLQLQLAGAPKNVGLSKSHLASPLLPHGDVSASHTPALSNISNQHFQFPKTDIIPYDSNLDRWGDPKTEDGILGFVDQPQLPSGCHRKFPLQGGSGQDSTMISELALEFKSTSLASAPTPSNGNILRTLNNKNDAKLSTSSSPHLSPQLNPSHSQNSASEGNRAIVWNGNEFNQFVALTRSGMDFSQPVDSEPKPKAKRGRKPKVVAAAEDTQSTSATAPPLSPSTPNEVLPSQGLSEATDVYSVGSFTEFAIGHFTSTSEESTVRICSSCRSSCLPKLPKPTANPMFPFPSNMTRALTSTQPSLIEDELYLPVRVATFQHAKCFDECSCFCHLHLDSKGQLVVIEDGFAQAQLDAESIIIDSQPPAKKTIKSREKNIKSTPRPPNALFATPPSLQPNQPPSTASQNHLLICPPPRSHIGSDLVQFLSLPCAVPISLLAVSALSYFYARTIPGRDISLVTSMDYAVELHAASFAWVMSELKRPVTFSSTLIEFDLSLIPSFYAGKNPPDMILIDDIASYQFNDDPLSYRDETDWDYSSQFSPISRPQNGQMGSTTTSATTTTTTTPITSRTKKSQQTAPNQDPNMDGSDFNREMHYFHPDNLTRRGDGLTATLLDACNITGYDRQRILDDSQLGLYYPRYKITPEIEKLQNRAIDRVFDRIADSPKDSRQGSQESSPTQSPLIKGGSEPGLMMNDDHFDLTKSDSPKLTEREEYYQLAESLFPYEITLDNLGIWRSWLFHVENLPPLHRFRLLRHSNCMYNVYPQPVRQSGLVKRQSHGGSDVVDDIDDIDNQISESETSRTSSQVSSQVSSPAGFKKRHLNAVSDVETKASEQAAASNVTRTNKKQRMKDSLTTTAATTATSHGSSRPSEATLPARSSNGTKDQVKDRFFSKPTPRQSQGDLRIGESMMDYDPQYDPSSPPQDRHVPFESESCGSVFGEFTPNSNIPTLVKSSSISPMDNSASTSLPYQSQMSFFDSDLYQLPTPIADTHEPIHPINSVSFKDSPLSMNVRLGFVGVDYSSSYNSGFLTQFDLFGLDLMPPPPLLTRTGSDNGLGFPQYNHPYRLPSSSPSIFNHSMNPASTPTFHSHTLQLSGSMTDFDADLNPNNNNNNTNNNHNHSSNGSFDDAVGGQWQFSPLLGPFSNLMSPNFSKPTQSRPHGDPKR